MASRPRVSFRAVITTVRPLEASCVTVSRPTPRLPPVTTAIVSRDHHLHVRIATDQGDSVNLFNPQYHLQHLLINVVAF